MTFQEASEAAAAAIAQTMADIEEEREERIFLLGLTPDNAQLVLNEIERIKESRL